MTPEPVSAALDAVRGALPPAMAAEVGAFRETVLARPGRLAAALRGCEAAWLAGQLTTQHLAELWAWSSYLAVMGGYAPNTTVAMYALLVHRWLAWAHERGLDHGEVTLSDLEQWQSHLYLTARHAASWRSRQASAVRNFYTWRHVRGLGPNCAAALRLPKENRKMPRKYSSAELARMLAVAPSCARDAVSAQRNTLLILFLLSTGARREEVTTVRITDIEIGRNLGVVRFDGKGSKERAVSIEGPVVEALRQWLIEREKLPLAAATDALFCAFGHGSMGPMSVSRVEKIIKSVAQAAKLREWGVHRFRVTFATALYDQGAEIEEIRILLGHESIETTRRYLAVADRARKTRLRSATQRAVLGQPSNTGLPAWARQAINGSRYGDGLE